MWLIIGLAPVFAAIHFWAVLTQPLPGVAAGLILYAGALALFWSAVAATPARELAPCFQDGLPRQVIVSGPFRYVRHPFYVSYLLAWTGAAAASERWTLVLTVIAMGVIYEAAARREESALLNGPVGNEYSEYVKRTGRYFPRLTRSAKRDG